MIDELSTVSPQFKSQNFDQTERLICILLQIKLMSNNRDEFHQGLFISCSKAKTPFCFTFSPFSTHCRHQMCLFRSEKIKHESDSTTKSPTCLENSIFWVIHVTRPDTSTIKRRISEHKTPLTENPLLWKLCWGSREFVYICSNKKKFCKISQIRNKWLGRAV